VNQADEVLAAAHERAVALRAGEADRLRRLLHPEFRWTTHTGVHFDREGYIGSNTGARATVRWVRQRLDDPDVTVVGDVAVLVCTVVDTVVPADGVDEVTKRMPMTQVWVRAHKGWQLLAGHAGPLQDG
jgi:hypothetical protein